MPLIAPISRWDRLEDPAGVMRSFCREPPGRPGPPSPRGGPSVAAVSDDPGGAAVLKEVRDERAALGAAVRDRVHLACLPMDDVEENAAIVNAIQRRAQIVVQKSLAEGFGLTVADAMLEQPTRDRQPPRGIQDQVVDGRTGILLDDREDLEAFAGACQELLDDPDRAARMGSRGGSG